MNDTVTRYLEAIPSQRLKECLRALFSPIVDRFSTQCLSSAGLAIKAGGGVLAKAVSVTHYLVVGKLGKLTANTDMAALSGTVVNATVNVFAFYVDAAGVLTSAMGTAAATRAGVILPPIPVNKALIGLLVINPTGTGNFVGNTTPLDDATVVPNAEYINAIGPMDFSVVI